MVNVWRAISSLFHPSVPTLIAFTIIEFWLRMGFLTFAVTTFFFSVLPFVITLYMMKKGIVSDVMIKKREQRVFVILPSILGYGIAIVLTVFLLKNVLISALEATYTINTTIILAITLRYKISIHTAVAGGMAAGLFYVLGWFFVPFFVIPPVVGYARIREKNHSIDQVLIGGIIGVVLTFLNLHLLGIRSAI
ncbi:hypothetical protein HS7_15770 [Sulfolobales archaeon HS-7]|nr:hypothetical protein HS7_15770 [Sulfolobales archaeon HS-7]